MQLAIQQLDIHTKSSQVLVSSGSSQNNTACRVGSKVMITCLRAARAHRSIMSTIFSNILIMAAKMQQATGSGGNQEGQEFSVRLSR